MTVRRSLKPFSLQADPTKPAQIIQKDSGVLVLQYYDVEGNLREIPVCLSILPEEIAALKDQLRLTRLFAIVDVRHVDATVMVPVDIQGVYIQVPVDIQGQAVDLVTVPKRVEDSKTVTSIDSETVVVDVDVRLYRSMGIALKNVGSNDLVYRVVGHAVYNGTVETTIVSTTTLAAGGSAFHSIDVDGLARLRVIAAAATSGNPSDLRIEYILKA